MGLVMMGAVLAMGAARPANAQEAPDTAALVRAVATVLVNSMVPRLGDRELDYVLPPDTPFDSAVAAVLLHNPGMRRMPDRRPSAFEWAGTRGFVLQGDTAVVRVEAGTHNDAYGGITTCIERNRFLFVRDEAGWRFLRYEFVSGADAGPVRGR